MIRGCNYWLRSERRLMCLTKLPRVSRCKGKKTVKMYIHKYLYCLLHLEGGRLFYFLFYSLFFFFVLVLFFCIVTNCTVISSCSASPMYCMNDNKEAESEYMMTIAWHSYNRGGANHNHVLASQVYPCITACLRLISPGSAPCG